MRSLSAPRRGEVHTQRFPAPPAPGSPHPKLWPRKVTHGSSPETPHQGGFPQPCFLIFYDFFPFAPQAPSRTQRDAPGSRRATPRHRSSTIPKSAPAAILLPSHPTAFHPKTPPLHPFLLVQKSARGIGGSQTETRCIALKSGRYGWTKKRAWGFYLFIFFLIFFFFLKADCLSRCLYL